MINVHNLTEREVLENLDSNESGLSAAEASKRFKENGPNTLSEKESDSLFLIFARQFQSPLIYVLLLATGVAVMLGEISDGFIICFILVVNAIIGTIQEGRAQATMRALKDFSKGRAVVLRDGLEEEIDDEFVTLGDIIFLRMGDKVPADGRILLAQNLKVDESALTGESEPVTKNVGILPLETPMPDRTNMLYKGTLVVAGEARAVVAAIGGQTFIGSISDKLSGIESEVPLKEKIKNLSRSIGVAVLVAVLAVIMIGYLRGIELREVFFTATAIAVCLIPEGLPVVITLILAKGVHRMAKRNALVKNMQAVEALGQASVIAVDKTGTITKNELTIQKVFTAGKEFSIGGSGYVPKGDIYVNESVVEGANHPELLSLAKMSALASNASIKFLENGEARVNGDPTEAALAVFGQKLGFEKEIILSEEPAVFEEPFSYDKKFNAILQKIGSGFRLSIVGEPESLMLICDKFLSESGIREINSEYKERFVALIEKFSKEGLRIIAFAFLETSNSNIDVKNLSGLCLAGICGMADVLREEVVGAIGLARENGVRTVMITGDHLGTAEAIARKAGIFNEGDSIVSGAELSGGFDPNRFDINRVSVFGRVLPEHKLKIVEAYKSRGEIIGMTGDGVNDALSLKSAHLGIAMGLGGTDVAKEAADLILLDNNFKSIVAAIEEGRSIYATIKKVVLYLISTSIGQFFTIFGALLVGLPLPIFPTQILWLNLVTDGFMVVPLAFEPNVDLKKTKRSSGIIFDRPKIYRSIFMSSIMMVGSLLVFSANQERGIVASSLVLTVLAVFQWFNAWNCRTDKESIFVKPFSNRFLILGLLGAILAQIFALYHPFMQNLLNTTPLGFRDWLLVLLVASTIIIGEEIRKFFARKGKMR